MMAEKMDVESLLLNDSFVNFCRDSSKEDTAYWEEYLRQHPRHAETVQEARLQFELLFKAIALADLEEQVTRMNNSIDHQTATVIKMEPPVGEKKWKRVSMVFKIAVTVLLMLGAFVVIQHLQKAPAVEQKIFEAAYGERKNVQLPDGSFVTLNAGSLIKINADYGVTSRDVCLKGEAFFDVKSDVKRPFIVHTHAMDIKALGTAFNVKAYKNENITEASLIKGVVEVTLKEDNNSRMLLYPNEKIKWSSNLASNCKPDAASAVTAVPQKKAVLKEKIIATNDGIIREIAWKANKLMFEDEPFDEIAPLLERWYGVKINFKDGIIRNYRFTGIFEKEELTTVLDFLKEARDFNYTVEKGESTNINLTK